MNIVKSLKNNFFSEKFCLESIAVACFVIAVYSLLAGFFVHSTALILDGALCFIDVLASFGSLFILKLINSPASEKFPFGYYKLEPLVVVLQAALLIAVCFISALHSIKDLFHHASFLKNYGWGFSYTIFTVLLDAVIYFHITLVMKRKSSALLELEKIDWKYSLWLTFGLLIGLLIAYLLQLSPNPSIRALTIYADPLMTFLIVIFIVKEPTILLLENFHDLVDKNPTDTSFKEQVSEAALACSQKLNITIKVQSFKLRRAGRVFFGTLVYKTNPDITLSQILQLNEMIEKDLGIEFENFYLDFSPTI